MATLFPRLLPLLAIGLALFLAACGTPPAAEETPDGAIDLFGTPQIGATAALIGPTQPSGNGGPQLLPSATPTLVGVPTPTPCLNDAQFIADLTIPDLSQVAPGAPLDKQWSIRNSGSCAWNEEYRLVFLEGTAMTAQLEHALYPARPGSDAIVRVVMVAPDVPGEYTSRWEFRDPNNQRFGTVVFIKIVVVASGP